MASVQLERPPAVPVDPAEPMGLVATAAGMAGGRALAVACGCQRAGGVIDRKRLWTVSPSISLAYQNSGRAVYRMVSRELAPAALRPRHHTMNPACATIAKWRNSR